MTNHRIKTIIADDEPDAVELLKKLLKDFSEIKIIATTNSASSAYKAVLKHEPDLLFLDIQMPMGNGIELSEKLRKLSIHPAIIFVTAYDKYAISAIRQAAFDYILKPVNRDELKEVVLRFINSQQYIKLEEKLDHLYAHITYPHKLRFNTRTGFIMIDPSDIIYCKAEGNYTEIYTQTGKRELITQNLGYLEQSLSPTLFYRISRFNIVNLNFISRIDRKTKSCEIGINGTTFKLPIPKKQMKELDMLLSKNN
jgi:DNA-binding LytR/AlgR family response regulator